MAITIPTYDVWYYDPTRRSSAGTSEHKAVFPRTATGRREAEKFASSVRATGTREMTPAKVIEGTSTPPRLADMVKAGTYGTAARVLKNVGTLLPTAAAAGGGGGSSAKAGSGRRAAG